MLNANIVVNLAYYALRTCKMEWFMAFFDVICEDLVVLVDLPGLHQRKPQLISSIHLFRAKNLSVR